MLSSQMLWDGLYIETACKVDGYQNAGLALYKRYIKAFISKNFASIKKYIEGQSFLLLYFWI